MRPAGDVCPPGRAGRCGPPALPGPWAGSGSLGSDASSGTGLVLRPTPSSPPGSGRSPLGKMGSRAYQELLEWSKHTPDTEKSVQQFSGSLGGEGLEPQPNVVRLAAPRVLVLGTVVHEQQQPCGTQAVYETVEYRLRFAIDPVQILEHEHQRLHLALTNQETFQCIQGAPPPPGRVERLPLRVLPGEIEERQECGQSALSPSVSCEELAGDLLSDGARIIVVANPPVDLEHLDHGEIGCGLAVGNSSRMKHEPAVHVRRVSKLPQEAGLAHS